MIAILPCIFLLLNQTCGVGFFSFLHLSFIEFLHYICVRIWLSWHFLTISTIDITDSGIFRVWKVGRLS